MVNAINQEFVKTFSEKIRNINGLILTEYQGLKVNEINEIRNILVGVNTEFHVIKNTLASISFDETELSELSKYMIGPTALVLMDVSSDPGQVVKKLMGFTKDHDKLKVKCGYVYGRLLTKEQIKSIATLPSREILIAQNIITLKSSLVRLLNVMQSPISKLVNVLHKKVELDKKQ